MKPEDLGAFFEEAFKNIEPKDESQREKMERLREKIAESQARMKEELEKLKRQQQALSQPEPAKSAAAEWGEIAQETRRQMSMTFEEQARIIESISGP